MKKICYPCLCVESLYSISLSFSLSLRLSASEPELGCVMDLFWSWCTATNNLSVVRPFPKSLNSRTNGKEEEKKAISVNRLCYEVLSWPKVLTQKTAVSLYPAVLVKEASYA